jgi:hypothetical protein
MANIAAFHLLYTCAIVSLCQRHSGQHWTLNKPSSSRIWPIQLSGDCCPLLSTARWHTNNPSTTTPTRQHAPTKHTHKMPILLAFTAKQKYSLCGGIAFYSSIRSKALSQVPFSSIFYNSNVGIGIPITTTTNPEANFRTKEPECNIRSKPLSQVPFSSIFYNSNVGIGIPITTTTNPHANVRTEEPCQQYLQMPYSAFDCGSGRAAYMGKDREEEMMEDMVEANEFFANLSCLNDNIDKNKNQGLSFDNDDDMVQPIVRK